MKILVTGATGFVGFRLIQHLQTAGHEVLATGRSLEKGQRIQQLGIRFQAGDICESAFAESLLPNQDAVIHLAGFASPWGPYADFYRANVLSTQNIIRACFKHSVPRLIQMSSPSVYIDGTHSRLNVREDEPVPRHFIHHYAETKYLADQVVLEAAAQGLKTVLLRPRAIIGAGDTVILPRVLNAHAQGKLRMIGDGQNLVDLTPVLNVCQGIDCALRAEGAALNQIYNLSAGEPVRLWEVLAEVFKRLDLKLSQQKIPFWAAYSLAKAMELAASLEPNSPEPALTRYSVIMLGRSQTLSIEKARQLLGFKPLQSTEQAIEEFILWWKRRHWLN